MLHFKTRERGSLRRFVIDLRVVSIRIEPPNTKNATEVKSIDFSLRGAGSEYGLSEGSCVWNRGRSRVPDNSFRVATPLE